MSTHSPIQAPRLAEDASASPVMQSVKPEPLSPSMTRKNPDTRDDDNPMALDKVLSSKNGAGRQHIRRKSGSVEETQSNKRQKYNGNEEGSAQALQQRTVLPKPVHTVSSHTGRIAPLTPPTTSSLLDKRQSKRKLMIIAPPPGGDIATGIRSAPLHSNFRVQQQQSSSHVSQSQQHPLQQHHFPPLVKKQGQRLYANPPKTASLLQPGHSLKPLLSPKMKDAAKNRHFAIPPIVPSQQQPPQSAGIVPNTSATAGTSSSSAAGSTGTAAVTSIPSVSRPGSTGPSSLSNNTAATSLPPMTPTTTSFAALQRQQFLQPFEHLFDTIETTRTLKATLDDQIRRSSSLIKTLQASSAAVEGLVRSKIKEVQKEVMGQMETSLEEMLERIVALEKQSQSRRDSFVTNSQSPPSPSPSKPQSTVDLAESSISKVPNLKNPSAIVPSHRDSRTEDYNNVNNMLNTLCERLERLEKQRDKN